VDQFFENTFNVNLQGIHLSTVPACDTAFDVPVAGCTAAANQSNDEGLGITGPASSTDQNGPFTITTTWTAAP
jgi:hypothetical protein